MVSLTYTTPHKCTRFRTEKKRVMPFLVHVDWLVVLHSIQNGNET